MTDRRLLVVGGGITGLAAALRLSAERGAAVELWEASSRIGGKIATSPFAGVDHVDEGADAFLTRVPHATAFAAAVGLGNADLTSPTSASPMVWHDGLHALPGGIMLGVPASVRPFLTSRLISWRGKLRAAVEPLLPRTDPDDALGRLIRARFGDEVHERLVDALIGSIYAADTDRWSLAAVPQLSQLASSHRSLLLGARAARNRSATGAGPIFAAPRRGMATLVDAAQVRLESAGAGIHLGRPARSIEPDTSGWRVDGERFDAVVLAAPATATAPLLATVDQDASRLLAGFEQADVIMVRLLLDAGAIPPRLESHRSGYLVAKSRQRLVTAVSFGSQKWEHWRPPGGGQILRVSLGRDGLPVLHHDDDAVRAAVLADLTHHLGGEIAPTEISITRWPGAFPQYRPHHHERVAEVERRLPPTLALAGASYRGIGIPACIADGERAAAGVLLALSTQAPSPGDRLLP